MRRRIRAIVKKEFIQIMRDWRSLIVAVMLPVVLLMLYGYGIDLNVKHLRTAVLDMDNSAESRKLLDSFRESGYFDFTVQLDSYSQMENTLGSGKAKAAIVVPRGFAEDIESRSSDVQIVVDGSDAGTASIAISYSSQIVANYSRDIKLKAIRNRGIQPSALQGLDVQTRYWYNPELNSTDFIVPGLICIILMLLSSLLTSMTIVRERERGTIEQVVVSPVRPYELVLGKLIPYVVIAFFDVILVVAGAVFIFGVPLRGSLLLLLGTSLIFLVAALGLGLLISSIAQTQLVAMTIAVMTTMLPTILLSGFVYPISTMPKVIRYATYVVPARYYLEIVRGIFLKGLGPELLWGQVLLLAAVGAVLIALSARLFKKVL